MLKQTAHKECNFQTFTTDASSSFPVVLYLKSSICPSFHSTGMALAKVSNKLFPEKSQDLLFILILYDSSAVLLTYFSTLYSHWASVTCHLLIQHVLLIIPSILFSNICFFMHPFTTHALHLPFLAQILEETEQPG